MNKIIAYILPKKNYFSEGYRGRVTHALGVIEGLIANQWETIAVSEDNLIRYVKKFDSSLLRPHYVQSGNRSKLSEIRWIFSLLKSLFSIYKKEDLKISLTRYAISKPLFNIFHAKLLYRNDIIGGLEVNSTGYNYLSNIPSLLRNYLLRFECYIFSQYDFIYVVSENMKKILLKGGCTSKIIVLPNASTAKQNQKTPINNMSKKDKTRFVYMGIFQKYYEILLVIEAFKQINKKIDNIELHFYGDGPLLSIIKSNAEDITNIYIHGRYQNKDVHQMINPKTDVLLLPYKDNLLTKIGSPIKLFEYLSLGTPIIASNIGQLSEIIKHEYNGFLYTSNNLDNLKTVMKQAHFDKKGRIRYGNNALDEFNMKHTWDKRFSKLERLLNFL